MGPHINIWNVTSDMKGSAPEPVKRETDTRVTCTVDALKHSETLYNGGLALQYHVMYMVIRVGLTLSMQLRIERTNLGNSPTANIRGKGDEIGRSSRIDDEVVQYKRQQDDNDLQDERQDQPKEEEVEPRRCKRARIEKLFGPDFVSFMVEIELTSYREAVTSSEWLNERSHYK
ncbi:hypothetical protein Tco_0517555 [Tanacetum coccineum]